MIRLTLLTLFILLCGATACSPGGIPAVVPTLMELPTDAPTATGTTAPPPTLLPTATPTQTETATQLATATPSVTPSLTITPTPTVTPSATWTITPTFTPTDEPRALTGLVALALQATVLPPTAGPALLPGGPVTSATPVSGQACATAPGGGFGGPYGSDPAMAALLGCPVGGEFSAVTAVQTFERGMMVYVSGQPGVIYALYNSGAFRRYTDTFVEGADLETSGETPPPGFLTPVRGFLKIWSSNADVRNSLGWGITQEAGNESRVLQFERGRMIYLPQRDQTVALAENPGGETGAWRALQGGG